jgi:hypothetical protein
VHERTGESAALALVLGTPEFRRRTGVDLAGMALA